MRKNVFHALWLLILLPVTVFAFAGKPVTKPAVQPTENFVAGKDYQIINATFSAPVYGAPVTVTEFFSYGCPACNQLEPTLEKWLAQKPNYVNFERVPVVFEPGWDTLAKAYYTARTLGVSETLSPAIFAAIHNQSINLSDPATLEEFFIKHGVSKADFESAFNFSPGIDAQLVRGDTLMRSYKVLAVPTIVINSKYKLDPSMVGGNSERLIQVTNYLVAKEKSAEKKVGY